MKRSLKYLIFVLAVFLLILPFKSSAAIQSKSNSSSKPVFNAEPSNYKYTKIKGNPKFHTSSGVGKKVLFINDGTYHSIDSTGWSGFSNIAELLRNEGYAVYQQAFSEISIKDLLPYNVVIFSTNSKSSLNDHEVDALRAFVQQGGGLFLQGEMYIASNASYYNSINQIGKPFGVTFDPGLLVQNSNYETGGGYNDPTGNRDMPIFTKMEPSPISDGVTSFRFNWGTTIHVSPPAKAVAYSQDDSWLETDPIWSSWYSGWYVAQDSYDPTGAKPVLATSSFGRGKMVAIGDSGIFQNGDLTAHSHQKLTLNIINWLGDIKSEKAHFEPFYPKSNTQYSSVMKGGQVIRYYKMLDAKNSPLRKVTFEYRMKGASQSQTAQSDENGVVKIVTPALYKSQDIEIQILSTNYTWGTIPKFHATVKNREFSQDYNLALGNSVSAGVGLLKAKLGPAEFDTVSATAKLARQTDLGITYDVNGPLYDLTMKNGLSGELSFDEKAGLFGGIGDLIKLNAGVSANQKARTIYEASTKFSSFNNQKSKDYNEKLLTSAYYTLESAILENPTNTSNALLMKVFDILGKKLHLKGARELSKEVQFGIGAGATIDGSVDFGAVSGKGALGTVTTEGVYSLKQAYNEKSKQTDYTVSKSVQAEGKILEGGVDIGFDVTKKSANDQDVDVSGEFGGVSGSVLDSTFLLNQEFTLEKDKSNKLKGIQLVQNFNPTTADGILIDSSTSLSNTVNISKDALTELSKKSKLLQKMNNGYYILEVPYNDFYKGVQTLSTQSPWKVEESQEKKVAASFDIELAAGIDLGFGLSAEGTYQLKYIKQKGVVSSDTGFLPTESYSYDAEIKNNEKNVQELFNEYGKALGALLTDTIDTVKRTLDDGITKVKGLGASLVDKGQRFADGAVAAISKLKNADIFSIKTANGTTSAIGDIYTVSIMDKNGNPIDDFASTPLQLTLDYSDAQLKARNLTSKEGLLSIYMWDGASGHYIKIASTLDKVNNHVTASITKSGQYLLAIDNEKPTVTGFTFVNNQQNGLTLHAVIRDNFSKLEKDNLQLSIDGQAVSLANENVLFNNYTGDFVFPLPAYITEGKHTATISVSDAGNNVFKKTLTFTIDRSVPTITNIQEKKRSDKGIDVQASIADNSFDTAIVEIKDTDNIKTLYVAQMKKVSGSLYKATIPAKVRIGRDVVYSIVATDTSGNVTRSEQHTISKIVGPALALKSTNLINGKADINQAITVKFNQYIQAGSGFDQLTIVNESNEPVAAYFTISDDTLFITPASPYVDGKKYRMIIRKDALADQSGKSLAKDVEIKFTAKKFIVEKPSKIEAQQTGTKNKVFKIQFTSPLKVTSINNGTVFIQDSYGNHIPIVVTLEKDQKTITIRSVMPYSIGKYNLFIENVFSLNQKILPVNEVIPFSIK